MTECLCYCPKLGTKPWFVKPAVMFIMDLFFVGWIPRSLLHYNTRLVNYEIIKYLHN